MDPCIVVPHTMFPTPYSPTMHSDELQKAATDADAVRALAALLTLPSAGARVREGVLRALGSLCMSRDEVRRTLIDMKV